MTTPVSSAPSAPAPRSTIDPWLPEVAPAHAVDAGSLPGAVLGPSVAPAAIPAERRADRRNLGLIVAGFLALLVLFPPQHEYSVIDDAYYASSVQHQLTTGTFEMPDRSQASLVGLTLWGTAWAR